MEIKIRPQVFRQDYYRTNIEICLREIQTSHLEEYAIFIKVKTGILTLSALLNTLEIPVNGYLIFKECEI